jgi:predicted transcriptional regulator
MKRSTAIALLIVALVMFASVALTAKTETVYPPFTDHLDTTQQFALSTTLVIGISSQSHTELNQPTRAEIYSLLQDNPGIHFRGICDALCLSVGMVQYHVGVLACAEFLTVFSDGKMQRFFVSGKYSQRQMKVISLLRHKTSGTILEIISNKKGVSHGELAAELKITSQGLTWQMHRLEKEGIVEETSNGIKLVYSINKTYAPTVNESICLVGQV